MLDHGRCFFLLNMAHSIDVNFYHSLAATAKSAPRFKWYMTAVVALGALNYPEEVPKLYRLLLDAYIPKAEHKSETTKIREALTKVCGIMGAAKVSSMETMMCRLKICY